MSQQGLRQAYARAIAGTSGTYEGDFHAAFDVLGIPAGTFDGRSLRWINLILGKSYTSLPEAMQALATTCGAYNFSSLGLIDPYPTATTALDFVAQFYKVNGVIAPLASQTGWTFTRASAGNALNSSGAIVSFGSGVPRITDLGILIEEARTNLFLNSFAPATQTITLSATGSYTITVWGSGSVTVAAGTATITNAGAASSGSPRTINCTATGTITATVSGAPTAVNVEAGAFGTSPITTTGTTATRAADAAFIGSLTAPATYTLMSKTIRYVAQAAGNPQAMLYFGDNSGSANFTEMYYRNFSGNFGTLLKSGGVEQLSSLNNGTEAGVGVAQTGAAAIDTAAATFAANGQVIYTQSGITIPVAPSQFQIGATGGGALSLNGYVQRAAIYPRALSSAELQALTQ